MRAGPRPQPPRAPRRPRPPSPRRAAPAQAATQSPGSSPSGARARGEGTSATDLRGCCGRAASAGDTDRRAHGGVALRRPPLLRLRWRQYLLSPPTSLPPTPPPSPPPPPPPNHRSTEGETQRLTTTWLPPPPPLPSPRPPGARNALREKREEGSAHRGAAPLWGFRRFSRALNPGQRELCACARSRRSHVSSVPPAWAPRLHLAGSLLVWAPPRPLAGVSVRLGRRGRGASERCVRLSSRVGPRLQNSLALRFLPCSSFCPNCDVLTVRTLLLGCWPPPEPDISRLKPLSFTFTFCLRQDYGDACWVEKWIF